MLEVGLVSEHAAHWLDMMSPDMLPFWLQGYADKQLKMHVDFLEAELSEPGCCDWAWQCRTGIA